MPDTGSAPTKPHQTWCTAHHDPDAPGDADWCESHPVVIDRALSYRIEVQLVDDVDRGPVVELAGNGSLTIDDARELVTEIQRLIATATA